MSTQINVPPSVALQYEKEILVMEDTTSPSDVVPPVRPFRALRQPAQVAVRRKALFMFKRR